MFFNLLQCSFPDIVFIKVSTILELFISIFKTICVVFAEYDFMHNVTMSSFENMEIITAAKQSMFITLLRLSYNVA